MKSPLTALAQSLRASLLIALAFAPGLRSADAAVVVATPAPPPVVLGPKDGVVAPEWSDGRIIMLALWPERLAPVGAATTERDNRAVLAVVKAFNSNPSDYAVLQKFVRERPASPWTPAILTNLGLLQYADGYILRALDCYEQAWTLGKKEKANRGKLVIDRALGELCALHARLGHYERLGQLLPEVSERPVLGAATERIAGAQQGFAMMINRPDLAFRCGPLALDRIYRLQFPGKPSDAAILSARSTKRGTSLAQVAGWASQAGLRMQAARRDPGAEPLLPSVLHWKAGHFGALLRKSGDRFLVEDATFKESLWVTPAALDEESSGYYLVPAGALPAGWHPVSATEAAEVWGCGQVNSSDPFATKTTDRKVCSPSRASMLGMPRYNFHAMLASLNIEDVPVGYQPPRGPAFYPKVIYNQREATQTTNTFWSNFGVKCKFNWFGYVIEDSQASRVVILPGGGLEFHSGFDLGNTSSAHQESQATLERVLDESGNTFSYIRHLPDGGAEEYGQKVPTSPSKSFYLTKVIDPQGNAATLSYNANYRISSISDASGGSNIFHYGSEDTADGRYYLIQSITDAHNRAASFGYDSLNRLASITDAVGLTSTLVYEGTGDFVRALVTPYGTTKFARTDLSIIKTPGNNPVPDQVARSIAATDPGGNTEYLEYRDSAGAASTLPPGVASDESASLTPQGILYRDELGEGRPQGQTLQYRNSYYWDRKAYLTAPRDYSKAHTYHWLHGADFASAVGVLESEKPALEHRIWYNYKDQHDATKGGVALPGSGPTLFNGTSLVSKRAQMVDVVADDGAVTPTTQLSQWEYNELGHPTQTIDPLGRKLKFVYDTNNIDLIEVHNIRNGQDVLLLRLEDYYLHRPRKMTDAAGQPTYFHYNTYGQLTYMTDARGDETSYVYNDTTGFLQNIKIGSSQGVGGSVVKTFTPDATGSHRIGSVADDQSYSVVYSYDNLDRVTKVTYPDNTYEETLYTYLDPQWTRNRSGQWSETLFDYARRPVLVMDALQRMVSPNWSGSGELQELTDAAGRTTRFEYDIEGRLTKKTFPDGKAWQFFYEAGSSRLARRIDGRNQTTTFRYFLDDQLKDIRYSDGTTPTVAYTYDPDYGRTATMVDGLGTTVYDYYPITAAATLGAGLLKQVTIPRGGSVSDTVVFTYEALGRVNTVAAAGATQVTTYTYDALGRVATVLNDVGSFTYGYLGQTDLIDHINRGTQSWLRYAWKQNAQDPQLHRLAQLKSVVPVASGSVLSQFDYGYDANGSITSWLKQRDGAMVDGLSMVYDAADELLRVVRAGPDGTTVLEQLGYAYDKAGHRTQEQKDLQLANTDHSSESQIVRSGGGNLRVWGTLNEAGTVSIDGQAASVDAANRFEGFVSITAAGTKSFTINATDLQSHTSSKAYSVTVTTPPSATYALDDNGNISTVSNSGPTYTWDAEDRLIKIVQGTSESTFEYDGLGRMVRDVEKQNGTQVADRRWLWVGLDRVAEFAGASSTASKRFYPQGFEVVGSPSQVYLYGLDHQGSVREVFTPAGTKVARYDYDPYGRRTAVGPETVVADVGYTGHFLHAAAGQSALWLAPYRAYDPDLGQWLSRDPIGEAGGLNLRGYADNNPITLTDPLGLCSDGGGEPLWGFILNVDEGEYYDVNDGSVRSRSGEVIRDRFGRPGTAEFKRRGAAGGSDEYEAAKYRVGTYEELRGTVPGLDAHHVGQKAILGRLIPGYDPETAPTILVPKEGHTISGPRGIVSRSVLKVNSKGELEPFTKPRDVVARDIRELRRVYPDIPNSQLQKLIDMNKGLYPSIKNK